MDSDKPDLRVVEGVAENGRSDDDDGGDAEKLSPLQLQFVSLVCEGATMDEAAMALGKSARTLRRWKRQPEVAEAIGARTAEQMALARATLASAANRAARELASLSSKAKPDTARIAACKAVIEGAARFGDLEEFASRLAAIEAQQGTQSAEPGRFHR